MVVPNFNNRDPKEILKHDKEAWNRLVKAHPNWGPDVGDWDLTDWDLQKRDLRNVKYLKPAQMAGSNLTDTLLPDYLEFDLDTVTDCAKNARTLFITLMFVCVFCWLTILKTSDLDLFLNTGDTKLPILNTPIPIINFYWSAPVLLLGMYIYFHLYLAHFWRLLGNLPVVFPDGSPLDEKSFPWLLTALIRGPLKQLDVEYGPIGFLRKASALTFGWLVVVATLIGIMLRSLPLHQFSLTWFQALFMIAAAVFGSLSWTSKEGRLLRQNLSDLMSATIAGGTALMLIFVLWLFMLYSPRKRLKLFDLGLIAQIDAPEEWEGTEKEIEKHKPLQLEGRNFKYANLGNAFLIKVNLRYAQLQNADLKDAQLQNAILFNAQLQNADLSEARLQNADLYNAQLQNADLSDTQLQNTDLRDAQLQNAFLFNAQLQNAYLRDAQLQNAILRNAQFQNAILFNAQFQNADLFNAQLQNARLFYAKFQNADLSNAQLQNADLRLEELKDAWISENTTLPIDRWIDRFLEDPSNDDILKLGELMPCFVEKEDRGVFWVAWQQNLRECGWPEPGPPKLGARPMSTLIIGANGALRTDLMFVIPDAVQPQTKKGDAGASP